MTQLVIVGLGAVVVATAIGAVLGVMIGQLFPIEEGNRPAPPAHVAANEQARLDALHKIAARSRQQDQRDASARLSRGF